MVETTRDALLAGRLSIEQPARGYRAGLDAALLGAAVESQPGARLLEAGCGVGAALLAAAWRAPTARFVGVEREPAHAALARVNAAANGMAERVEVFEADLFAMPAIGTFDGAFFNPPFAREGEGAAPRADRAHAYVTEASLDRWVKALADRLTGGAALTLIHRAERLPDILEALAGRLGGAEAFPVRPKAGVAAHRVLVRARKGSRAPFRLLAGLDLHEADGRFTTAAEAIFRDGAPLSW